MNDWQTRLAELWPLIPDPCGTVQIGAHARADPRPRWASQRAKRSLILGNTRQIVAEDGLDNVQITAVAQRSGVSVQTIYNVVGNRSEMLGAAASEWVVALAEQGPDHGAKFDRNGVFTTIELFWAAAILYRGYTEKLIRAQAQCTLLERPFLSVTEMILTAQLVGLRAQGTLSRWASVPVLARHLAFISHGCVRDWLAAPYDERRFREALVVGCGLMLRGACEGSEVARIEQALDT